MKNVTLYECNEGIVKWDGNFYHKTVSAGKVPPFHEPQLSKIFSLSQDFASQFFDTIMVFYHTLCYLTYLLTYLLTSPLRSHWNIGPQQLYNC
jgi:hypothetical protein